MGIGIFNPRDNAGSVTPAPAIVTNGAGARKFMSDSGATLMHAQDFNLLWLNFYAAIDALGLAATLDVEGNTGALLGLLQAVGAAGRNYIDNASLIFWQENTTYSPLANTVTHIADRFKVRRGVANYIVSRAAGFAGAPYSVELKRTAGSTELNALVLAQQLPSERCSELVGKKVRLSCDVIAGADYSGGNLALDMTPGAGVDEAYNLSNGSFATANGANLGNTQSFLPGVTAARMVSSQIIIPAGTTELAWRLYWTPVGTAGANDWVRFTRFKLEIGENATSFVAENPGVEIHNLLRFYQKSFNRAQAPVQNLGVTTGEHRCMCRGDGDSVPFWSGNVHFEVPMRAIPSVTLYNPKGANALARNYATSADAASAGPGMTSESCFDVLIVTDAGALFNHTFGFHWTADARL